MAGTSPKRMPVSRETPSVKSSTRQSRPTEAPFLPTQRQIGGADGEQRANADVADNEAEDAAGEGEHEALGEQLANDAGATSAHGGADGELALAAGGTDQEQVGDIGAGDEQNEADGSEQNQQRGASAGNDGVAQRLHAEAGLGIGIGSSGGGIPGRRASSARWPAPA